jgi:hypothetical protein
LSFTRQSAWSSRDHALYISQASQDNITKQGGAEGLMTCQKTHPRCRCVTSPVSWPRQPKPSRTRGQASKPPSVRMGRLLCKLWSNGRSTKNSVIKVHLQGARHHSAHGPTGKPKVEAQETPIGKQIGGLDEAPAKSLEDIMAEKVARRRRSKRRKKLGTSRSRKAPGVGVEGETA